MELPLQDSGNDRWSRSPGIQRRFGQNGHRRRDASGKRRIQTIDNLGDSRIPYGIRTHETGFCCTVETGVCWKASLADFRHGILYGNQLSMPGDIHAVGQLFDAFADDLTVEYDHTSNRSITVIKSKPRQFETASHERFMFRVFHRFGHVYVMVRHFLVFQFPSHASGN